MKRFYQVACTYEHLGLMSTRSFSVVADHAEEAFDLGVSRMTSTPLFPNEFTVAISLAGTGILHRKYNWTEVALAEITAAINGGE